MVEENDLLDNFLGSFNEWLHSICIITFDLELGQTIEVTYPKDVDLSPAERLQVCYLSFPDSNNNCTRDTSYHFRIRRTFTPPRSPRSSKFESQIPIPMTPCGDYLFGFVHFRQQKDASIPRGYFQKSVVLLTRIPLIGLYLHIVDKIAYNFFEFGVLSLEKACHQIDRWQPPTAGETMNLKLYNSVIVCKIPCRTDSIHQQQLYFKSQDVADPSWCILSPMVQETFLYNSTRSVLVHIQQLWELILLGEPLLAMASTPVLCSQLVQSLVSLIWPLKFCSDYRPFFTIHDMDFNEITSPHVVRNIVIGVTNPFFAKVLKHWPHILRIGDASSTGESSAKTDKNLKKISSGKRVESKPGFYTRHKPYLHPDKSLLKKLLKVGERPDTVQNAILRKHFLELTHNFLIPLERHISSLMPLQKHIIPFHSLPQTKPFLFDEFLRTLNKVDIRPNCGIKGDWKGLYEHFITRSPNFQGWLSRRLEDVDKRIRVAHSELILKLDLSPSSILRYSHVEVVDIVLTLKDKLDSLNLSDAGTERQDILKQLNSVFRSVDEDLRSVLLSNEALRDIFAA